MKTNKSSLFPVLYGCISEFVVYWFMFVLIYTNFYKYLHIEKEVYANFWIDIFSWYWLYSCSESNRSRGQKPQNQMTQSSRLGIGPTIKPIITDCSKSQILCNHTDRAIWESKILRIFALKNEDGEWRIRTNREIYMMIGSIVLTN